MQTLNSAATSERPSSVAVIRSAMAESGIRSLYTGLTASLLRQMTYSLVRIGSYEEMKRRITKKSPPSSAGLLAAACLAGMLGGLAGNPSGETTDCLYRHSLAH